MSTLPLPPLRHDLLTGIDVGGTKVDVVDTATSTIRRYATADYSSLPAMLEAYFGEVGARPAAIAVGMAGPRDDDTGEIKLTNLHWPPFDPSEAGKLYGIKFLTANDMVVTTAGVLDAATVDTAPLKPGTPARTGTKLVVTISTGIGVAAAAWDARAGRYVIIPGEGGHIGFQPKTAEESAYLAYLHAKYPHASAELALGGKHGIGNLVDHVLVSSSARKLSEAVAAARATGRPLGGVLLAFVAEGEGADRSAAEQILQRMGAMIGSVLRDLAVAYMATGGIYLTGSIALTMGEYLAEHTALRDRFVRPGAAHDNRLEHVPISLLTDPHIAARGALALAKEL